MLKIFGINIRSGSAEDVLKLIDLVISKKTQVQIATVNNEILIESRKNKEFKTALTKSHCIADSTGVVLAVFFKYFKKIERIPGVDLFYKICERAQEKNYKIFLFGGGRGIAHVAKSKLEDRYPGIKIVGIIDGDEISPEKTNLVHLTKINKSEAQIIAVALGAPKQELWIRNNMTKIKANVFIGLGGTLDFVSLNVQRAPLFIRRLGLEWLFRLIKQPNRFFRIIKAVIVFPFFVLFDNTR